MYEMESNLNLMIIGVNKYESFFKKIPVLRR